MPRLISGGYSHHPHVCWIIQKIPTNHHEIPSTNPMNSLHPMGSHGYPFPKFCCIPVDFLAQPFSAHIPRREPGTGGTPGDPRGAWSCCVRNLRGSIAVDGTQLGYYNNTWGPGASSILIASYSPPMEMWQTQGLKEFDTTTISGFFSTHLWSPHRQTSPTKHWNYTIYHLQYITILWKCLTLSIPIYSKDDVYHLLPWTFWYNQTWLAGKKTPFCLIISQTHAQIS